jgi:hypothetical protein
MTVKFNPKSIAAGIALLVLMSAPVVMKTSLRPGLR